MENKIYAVIDTNVIVSALIAASVESPPFIVMAQIYSGAIIPVFNDEMLREYQEVLSRPKFHLSSDLLESCIEPASSTKPPAIDATSSPAPRRKT